ncbi:hypothetical protein GE21DRAFT_1274777 [Neurospora crassa]|nr:hypothetical protein GE21DRAFT_1274777 [Neurospora crassa]
MSAMSLPARTPSGGTACFEPPSNNRLNASEREKDINRQQPGHVDLDESFGEFENIPLTDAPNTPVKAGKQGHTPVHNEDIQQEPTPSRLVVGDGLVPSHDFKQTSEETKASTFRHRMFSFESPSDSPELKVMPNKDGTEIRRSLDAESFFDRIFPVRSTSSSYPSEGVKSPELTVSPPMTFGRRILSSLESYGFSTSSFLRSSEESVGSRQHHRLNPAAVEGALREIYREQEAATNNEVIECETQPSVAGDNKSIKITKQELAKPEVEHIEDIGHRKTPSLNGSDAKEVIADISAVNTELIISLANAALHRGKSNSSMLPRQRRRSTGPDNTGETPFPSLDLAPCGRALASSKAGLLSEEALSNLSTQCLPRVSTNPPRLSTEFPTTLEKGYLKPKSRAALPISFGSPIKIRNVEVAPTVPPVTDIPNVPLLTGVQRDHGRKPSGPYLRQQSKKKSSILRLLRYIFRRPIKAKKWFVRKFRAKRKGVSKRFKTKTKARKEKKKRILELPKVEDTIVAPVTGEEVESVIVPLTVLEKPATAPVTAIQVDAVKAELKQVEQIASDEHVSVAEKELTIKAVVEKKIGSDEGSVEEVEDITVEIHVVDASTCVA